jgi:ABC-2 type transport system ATP-binding protein
VVLSDERSWYWRLSGQENLEFFARLCGLSRAAAQARCVELLAASLSCTVASRRVDGYSAGMRSRLSLARALLLRPAVLLLDEPTRALDPAVSRDLRMVVTDLVRQHSTAVLWVTHDLHEAAALGGRVVLMDAGRVRTELPGVASAEELERLLGIAP